MALFACVTLTIVKLPLPIQTVSSRSFLFLLLNESMDSLVLYGQYDHFLAF